MVDWVSLSIPLAYSTILIGSLAAFSWAYRRRQALHAASLEPWFGQHLQRDIYYTLWNQDGGDSKVPESVLKAALLRRAAEDVSRIIQMRANKQALTSLLAQGRVGDDLWQRFQRAEKEIEAELQDVVSEANALAPGWGQVIFQSANEMAGNTRLRVRLDEIQALKAPEREWWDKKRETLRTEFMKELENEGTPATAPATTAPSTATTTTASDATVTAARTAAHADGSRRGSVAGGSDEDGVIVDAASSDGTAPNTPTTSTEGGVTGAAGGSKKKSNKKKNKK